MIISIPRNCLKKKKKKKNNVSGRCQTCQSVYLHATIVCGYGDVSVPLSFIPLIACL